MHVPSRCDVQEYGRGKIAEGIACLRAVLVPLWANRLRNNVLVKSNSIVCCSGIRRTGRCTSLKLRDELAHIRLHGAELGLETTALGLQRARELLQAPHRRTRARDVR